MHRELDIIIFGATGFTGRHAIPLIVKFGKDRQLKWGIADRCEEKLMDLWSRYETELGTPLNEIPLILADVHQEITLKAMARRARVIINCCGPYYHLGEPVVKACVEEGTHHVDVSGESQYMEKIQLKYHNQAKQKGIYIITACGFQSMPADLGIVLLQEKFNGTVNSCEVYLDLWEETNPGSGIVTFNAGSWESMIGIYGYANELKSIRKQLFLKWPTLKPHLPLKFYPRTIDTLKGWILPFLGPDRPVIKRSQQYFYENSSKRPVQVETYIVVNSFIRVMMLAIFWFIFLVLTQFEFGRGLLVKYRKVFSGGFCDYEPPSEEHVKNARFKFTLYAEGWKGTLPGANHEFSTPPNKTMSIRVSGDNPVYGANSVCMVLAAITLITESEKMPVDGGVYPPGYAFAGTSLIGRLNENGVKFEVLK